MPATRTPPANQDRGKPIFWTAALLTAFLALFYFTRYHLSPLDVGALWASFFGGPVDPSQLMQNYLAFAWTLLCAAGAVLAYVAVGSRAARAVQWTQGTRALDLPLAFAVGGGLYGLLFQALGSVGVWNRKLLVTCIVLGILPALKDLVYAVRAERPSLPPMPRAWEERLAWGACLLLGWLAVWHGMTGDVFYDTQVYHLAVPEAYLAHHGFVDLPDKVFAHFPFGGEWFLWGGYLLGGPAAAKLVNTAALLAAATLAFGLARRVARTSDTDSHRDSALPTSSHLNGEAQKGNVGYPEATIQTGSSHAGPLAFLLVATCPLLNMVSWSFQVEGVLVLMSLAFLTAFSGVLRTEGEASSGWAACGWFLGLAMAVKYNGVLLLLFLLPPFLAAPGRIRLSMKPLASFLPASAAALGPHLVRNFAYAGNPVYPYLSSFLGGRRPWPPGLSGMMADQRQWHVAAPEDWLALPWRLFMDSPNGYNFLGPVLLAAPLWIAAAWLIHRSRSPEAKGTFPPIGTLTGGTALFFGLGLTITHLPRFLMPGVGALYVAAAVAAATHPPLRRMVYAAVAACALGALPILSTITLRNNSPQGVWTGRESQESWDMRAGVTPYGFLREMVRQGLRPNERVLVVGDARGAGYDHPVVTGSVFDLPLLVGAVREAGDPAGVWRVLHRNGIDAVAVNVEEGMRTCGYRQWDLTPEEWTRLHEFVRHGLGSVRWENKGVLFHLRPAYGGGEWPAGMPDPFLYLAPQAGQYAKAAEAHATQDRDRLLDELSALQTFTPQWYEEKAIWLIQEGKTKEAEVAWKAGSARGPLQKASYQEWRRILTTERRLKELDKVTSEARRYYPD